MKLKLTALLFFVNCASTIFVSGAFSQSSSPQWQKQHQPRWKRRQFQLQRKTFQANSNHRSGRPTSSGISLPSSASSADSENAVFALRSSAAPKLGKIKAALIKAGMMGFIASMCLALPIALFPPQLLLKMGLINRVQKEQMALHAGQFCARWLLRLIPFCSVKTIPYHDLNPVPSIWVCNHVSALDIFMLLAKDLKMRGKNKRPIKIVYVSSE